MFCPKCGAQNIEDASFCRTCGANISLVPQALTGRLPEAQASDSKLERRKDHRHKSPATVEKGIETFVCGIGFLLVAIAIAIWGKRIGGDVWWFWLLIPAFSILGSGIATIMRAKREEKKRSFPYASPAAAMPPTRGYGELPSQNTSEFAMPPRSVTEGTTRHLDATKPARPHNVPSEE